MVPCGSALLRSTPQCIIQVTCSTPFCCTTWGWSPRCGSRKALTFDSAADAAIDKQIVKIAAWTVFLTDAVTSLPSIVPIRPEIPPPPARMIHQRGTRAAVIFFQPRLTFARRPVNHLVVVVIRA